LIQPYLCSKRDDAENRSMAYQAIFMGGMGLERLSAEFSDVFGSYCGMLTFVSVFKSLRVLQPLVQEKKDWDE
jgi:hypothetical protein